MSSVPIRASSVRTKKADTRERRIERTVTLAAMNLRANHPGVRIRDAAR
ncbi:MULTISPECIES: hypothetical protein [Rhodococcus]|nr:MULTISPECIES: hypothetical protein [Rhodococcus]QSE85548.1 hypothetical protein JWS14_36305 [Rhodococcus koreensis]